MPEFEQRRIEILANQESSVATRTATALSIRNVRAIQITVVTANKDGSTAEYTPKLRGYLADGSTTYDLWTAAAAITAAGTVRYLLGELPNGTLATYTESKGAVLPEKFDVQLVAASADGLNNMDTRVEVEIWPR